ncbi:MAG: cation diffusion facilitator family transporter [Alphaproteobacteria bacterium]
MVHDHDHTHEEGEHHHDHVPKVSLSNERRVFWVMVLTGGFMVVEAVGGILSGSLALLADAGHMLTDTAALALAWFAFRIGNRPADPKRSFGYHRFQILAAFANGLILFAIAGWIVIEAVRRLLDPSEIHGISMIAVAAVGLLVNIIGFWIMSRGEKENLNIRSAALHVMGDLLGSVAAIIAAGIILLTGWLPIDPILSVLVALLILRSAWAIIKQSSHILLQGTPEGLDPARIGAALGDIEGVFDVHDVHAWSLTNERPVVTLHTVLDETADYNSTLQKINNVLKEKFGIEHATIQLERKQRTH